MPEQHVIIAMLKWMMHEMDASQEQIGWHLGVSQPTVGRWLDPEKDDPSYKHMRLIYDAALRLIVEKAAKLPKRSRQQKRVRKIKLVEAS